MKESNQFLKIMSHEEKLRVLFRKNTIIKFISEKIALWENLCFALTLILNFIIVVSYSVNDVPEGKYTYFYYYTAIAHIYSK